MGTEKTQGDYRSIKIDLVVRKEGGGASQHLKGHRGRGTKRFKKKGKDREDLFFWGVTEIKN